MGNPVILPVNRASSFRSLLSQAALSKVHCLAADLLRAADKVGGLYRTLLGGGKIALTAGSFGMTAPEPGEEELSLHGFWQSRRPPGCREGWIEYQSGYVSLSLRPRP